MTSILQTVAVTNAQATSPVLLICEHASRFVPDQFDGLGLSNDALKSHIAWDPGALAVSQRLCAALDAKLVAGCVSRLVYDCNRPLGVATATPALSELTIVPGNVDLSETERAARAQQFYAPFRNEVSKALAGMSKPVIVTIHSFTPIYKGQKRTVDIGILHDDDTRLADQMLTSASAHTDLSVLRNAPYGPQDGVTHTLREHGLNAGHLNVMIEIRNDLISDSAQQEAVGDLLAGWIASALETLSKDGVA